MSYILNTVVHKVSKSDLEQLHADYPFTAGYFKVIDSLDEAVAKITDETNRSLPSHEAVLSVENAYEDVDNRVYRIALKIMD